MVYWYKHPLHRDVVAMLGCKLWMCTNEGRGYCSGTGAPSAPVYTCTLDKHLNSASDNPWCVLLAWFFSRLGCFCFAVLKRKWSLFQISVCLEIRNIISQTVGFAENKTRRTWFLLRCLFFLGHTAVWMRLLTNHWHEGPFIGLKQKQTQFSLERDTCIFGVNFRVPGCL